MIATTDPSVGNVAELQDMARRQAQVSPAWMAPLREAGMATFSKTGFPTTRLEDWRYTNVDRIANGRFALGEEVRVNPTPDQLAGFAPSDLACSTIVFVNGHYAPQLSSLRSLPDGVQVAPLAAAAAADQGVIQRHLAKYALCDHDAFTALNMALFTDGIFVHVPRDTVVKQPIHLVNVAAESASPIMTHPRNLIVCEAGGELTVVEHYVSLTSGVYLTNAVTEVFAGESATVDHYLIEEESLAAFNVSSLAVYQQGRSNVTSHTVLFGGTLVRNNVHPVLDGEGCMCLINGVFVASDAQHLDNFMRVEHLKAHGDSRQFYKGILDGKSHGVFSGRIYVEKGAQKTDAKQTSANLLLSDEAHIDTKPQLEIYADDVKCTHGATIGQIDEDAVFYLRARGIDEDTARAMVIYAFAAESFERMNVEPIRKLLARKLIAKLPNATF